MEWLLQLIDVIAAFVDFIDELKSLTESASAPISSSVSPLSLSTTFHSAASFPPVTS